MWKVESGGGECGWVGVNYCRCKLLRVIETVDRRSGCVGGAVDVM